MRERLLRAFHPTEQGKNIIKINGKAIKGEWIEGKNVFIDDKNEKAEMLYGYTNYRIAYEVIPETICEYAGLTDKNGNKIFEGHIVKLTPPPEDDKEIFVPTPRHPTQDRILEVVFYQGEFAVDMSKWWKYNDGKCSLRGYETERLEVIGNIYDNPELLK